MNQSKISRNSEDHQSHHLARNIQLQNVAATLRIRVLPPHRIPVPALSHSIATGATKTTQRRAKETINWNRRDMLEDASDYLTFIAIIDHRSYSCLLSRLPAPIHRLSRLLLHLLNPLLSQTSLIVCTHHRTRMYHSSHQAFTITMNLSNSSNQLRFGSLCTSSSISASHYVTKEFLSHFHFLILSPPSMPSLGH
jgi:hypothetical protein